MFTCSIPASPTVQQDDADNASPRWDFPPGASTGWHEHGLALCGGMLTDAQMHVHDGEQVAIIPRRAGESYARPAGIRHDVKNGGEAPMAFVEIETETACGLRDCFQNSCALPSSSRKRGSLAPKVMGSDRFPLPRE